MDSTTMQPDRKEIDPKWWTLTAVCLGTFMLLLDITIVNVALPAIQTSLGSSFADLQWVVDAYALTLATFLLTAGSLADLLGRRKLWIVGLIVFTAASALCAAAQNSLMLELSRALQGVGGAIMFAVSLALLANAFHGKDRGLAFGVWGAITGVAVAVGPIVGGALVTGLSWRYIFIVNVPIGIIAVVLTVSKVAESRNEHARKIDWAGFALLTIGLASFVYGLIESGSVGFGATIVLLSLALAAVSILIFIAVELRNEHAMFDLSLFRLPTFTGGSIAAFGVSAGIFSILLYLVLYLQDVLGYSALQTGLRLLVLSGGIMVVAGITGRLTSKVPIRALIGPGLALVAVALYVMRGLTSTSHWTHLVPGLIIGGIGVGFINPPLASTAVGVVHPRQAGMASGINSTFRQIGIATGIALLGTIFASRLRTAVESGLVSHHLALHVGTVVNGLEGGTIGGLFTMVSPAQRGALEVVITSSFTTALNEIFLVAAIVSAVAAVLSFVLIRSKDFVVSSAGATAPSH
jgi:EmrB/QacA subfamily drug resistance transporter